MNHRYRMLAVLFLLAVIAAPGVRAQQALDSADVYYFDNTSDNNTGTTGTLMNDPKYREWPPTATITPGVNDGWYSNNSSVYFGGNHRRASRQGSGNNTGAHAQYYCTLTNSDYYLVYHHMNSGNSTTNSYVTFKRFGEGVVADSFRYNMLTNNTPDGWGCYQPLGIVQVFAADSALTVEIGLDSLGSNTLRLDVLALVRSRKTGPDIEFGPRRFTRVIPRTTDTLYQNFYTQRSPIGFSETTFKWNSYSEQRLPVYNLGSQPLIISRIEFQTTRYSVTNTLPITIQPGGKANLTIRFSPKGEEVTNDTMMIYSNDTLESPALQPLTGIGINYNFILNASVNGSEPHWNVPAPGGVFETFGSFLSSTATPWPYPIPGGNINSVVNTGSDPSIAVFYKFNMIDSLFGNYFLEYAGPAGSSNAAQNVKVDVVTPFYANPDPVLGDTQRVTGFNSRAVTAVVPWARIGGNRVFQLNGGGQTVVRFMNPSQGGTELLRADLLRVRMVPIAPTIATNLDPARLLNFGSVSIYDSIRLQQFNYQRTVTISSNGETPLRIDSIYKKRSTTKFEFVNLPRFPLTLPSIDGKYNLLVNFLPDSIIAFSDTMWIKSNHRGADSLLRIVFTGQGVGTGITVDDNDPTSYIYPANPIIWAGAPDPANMDKWYRVQGSGGINQNRLIHYIYFNPPTGTETIEWFPYFPLKPGQTQPTVDSFDVYLNLSTGSASSSPRAKYIVYNVGPKPADTVWVNQNSTSYGGQVPSSGRVLLGRYQFLRGGQDYHGSGTIFGSIALLNDTAAVSAVYRDSLVNTARRDSFVLRADAVILEQAGRPLGVTEVNLVPEDYMLSQNYPNPFNPTTQIRFAIPNEEKVELKIYDMLGREITTLMKDNLKPGYYTVEWNGRNQYGSPVATGMYIYRIIAGKFVQTKKMILVK